MVIMMQATSVLPEHFRLEGGFFLLLLSSLLERSRESVDRGGDGETVRSGDVALVVIFSLKKLNTNYNCSKGIQAQL